MNLRNHKLILALFTGALIILLGVLVYSVSARDDMQPTVPHSRVAEFERDLPRLILHADSGLHFDALYREPGQFPEIVFSYPFQEPMTPSSALVRSILASRFTILGEKQTNHISAFGVGEDNWPVGRFILKPDPVPYRASVGIIIDDFGYFDTSVVDSFLALPPEMTFAVIPGHRYSREIAEAAVANGFEVMIHMPMEPEEYSGGEEEYILKTGMTTKEIKKRLSRALESLPEAVGMNNHQGSLATQHAEIMSPVMNILKEHGMYFIDSITSPATVCDSIAKDTGVMFGARRVFLDNEADTTYIRNQLDQLVQLAVAGSKVIGIGHNHPLTFDVLKRYIPYYESQGIRFVRITDLLSRREPVM